MNRAMLTLATTLSLACSASDLAKGGQFDTAAGVAEADEDATASGPARLRVDILPSGDSAYLPQSFVYDLQTTDPYSLLGSLSVDLEPSRTLAGRVTAFEAAPFSDVSVPGTTTSPFLGRLSVTAPEGLARRSVDVDDGSFEVQLPAATDYRLAIQPADSALQPFVVLEPFDLTESDTDFLLELGFGSPVHGRVVQSDGSPAPGVTEVWLEDGRTGLAGPRVATDIEGNFMLRAFEGEHRLVAQGSERSTIPRVSAPVTVVGGDATRVDLDLGFVDIVEAGGRVVDADGRGLYQATIRFTSLELDEAAGQIVVEDDADSDGDFELDILPGLWQVEVIPPFDSDGTLGPVRLDDVVVDGAGVDMGTLSLPERRVVSGLVEAPDGGSPGVVTVVARELGFDHYVYTTVSDSTGRFELAVPDVPVEVAYLPSRTRQTVTWVEYREGMASRETIVLSNGIDVQGLVDTPTGPSVAALVDIVDADTGRSYGTALTDDDGRFELRVALDERGGWLQPGAGDTGI